MKKIKVYRANVYTMDLSDYINITDEEIIQPNEDNNTAIWCGKIENVKYMAPFELFSVYEFKQKIEEYHETSKL